MQSRLVSSSPHPRLATLWLAVLCLAATLAAAPAVFADHHEEVAHEAADQVAGDEETASDEQDAVDEQAEVEGVTTRNPSAKKMRKKLDDAQKDLQSGSAKKQQKAQQKLQTLETQAGEKLDRALTSTKQKKLQKVGEREQLVGDIQDALSAQGTPLKLPRRRWRDAAPVGGEVPIDAGDFAGRYRNGKRLAEGAQGSVDLLVGEGPQAGQVLVLKSTKAELGDDPTAAARTRTQQRRLLQREADIQNLAAEGDNVPPHFVRARQVADNQVVMPYGGGSMKRILRDLKADLAQGDITDNEYKAVTQELARQMLTAARHMDSQGVVHRDLKPDNIVLDPKDGMLKLVDFGAAKRRNESDSDIAGEGVALGTEGYMAPEQFARRFTKDMSPAELADFNEREPNLAGGSKPKSDVYSIGKILDRDMGRAGMGAQFDDFKQLLTRPQTERPRAGVALAHPFLTENTGVTGARVRQILGDVATRAEDPVAQAQRPRPVAPGPVPRPPAAGAGNVANNPGPAGNQPVARPPAGGPGPAPRPPAGNPPPQ